MSKSVLSCMWFARVDGAKEFLKIKLEELAKSPDTVEILGAYHKGKSGENPHCHFVVKTCMKIQKQSYALRIKPLFCIEKKTQYALQPWDGHRTAGAVSYLFHEEDVEILVNKGFSEGEISDARKSNDAVQRVIAINKEKASNKLVEKLYEQFKGTKQLDRIEMLAYMLKEIKLGNNYHPGEFMLKRYIEEVEVRLCPDDFLIGYASNLCARLWKTF